LLFEFSFSNENYLLYFFKNFLAELFFVEINRKSDLMIERIIEFERTAPTALIGLR